jgi:hypothetical protein
VTHPAGLANRVGRVVGSSRPRGLLNVQDRLIRRLHAFEPELAQRILDNPKHLIGIRAARTNAVVTEALRRLVDRAEGC